MFGGQTYFDDILAAGLVQLITIPEIYGICTWKPVCHQKNGLLTGHQVIVK